MPRNHCAFRAHSVRNSRTRPHPASIVTNYRNCCSEFFHMPFSLFLNCVFCQGLFSDRKVSSSNRKTKTDGCSAEEFAKTRMTCDQTKKHPRRCFSFGAVRDFSAQIVPGAHAARSDCFRFPAGQKRPTGPFCSPLQVPMVLNKRHPFGMSLTWSA